MERCEAMTWWRVVTTFAVAGVRTDDHEWIVETAPILKQFVGQPLDNLRNWNPVLEVARLFGPCELTPDTSGE